MTTVTFEVESGFKKPSWYSTADRLQTGVALSAAARLMPFVNTLTLEEVVASVRKAAAEEEKGRAEEMAASARAEARELKARLDASEKACAELRAAAAASKEALAGRLVEAERRGGEGAKEKVGKLEADLASERERSAQARKDVEELFALKLEAGLKECREEAEEAGKRAEAERRAREEAEEKLKGAEAEIVIDSDPLGAIERAGFVIEREEGAVFTSDEGVRVRLVLDGGDAASFEEMDTSSGAKGVLLMTGSVEKPRFSSEALPILLVPVSASDEQVEVCLHLLFDALRTTPAPCEGEGQDTVREHFDAVLTHHMGMFDSLSQHATQIGALVDSLNTIKARTLVHYRECKRANASVSWLKRPMHLAFEGGYEHALRMTREGRFNWNNVTKRAELEKGVGKEAVRMAVEMEIEREEKRMRV